ncbi:MAG: leucine-rich repeat domain-containing protein [Oscillospiraceae bacterium]|nr:leucine-rich repeat domain-containing protein [Oscillospiraceae bacterium]
MYVFLCEICGSELTERPKDQLECETCGLWYDAAWKKSKLQSSTMCLAPGVKFVHEPEEYDEFFDDFFSFLPTQVQAEEGVLKKYRGEDKEFTITKGITQIGKAAFESAIHLETLRIPEGVTIIGEKAFRFCAKLKSAYLPASVTQIGVGAFDLCEELTIYAPEGSYAYTWAKENHIPVQEV